MEIPDSPLAGESPRRGCARSPRPSTAKRLLFSAVYLLFLLAVAECVLSFVSRRYYPRLTVSDGELGWKFTPTGRRITRRFSRELSYDIHINSDGFRDDEFRKDADFKILVLGDSMTLGAEAGQDKIFCALLEQRLTRELYPKTVDVMNFGMAAFSTGQELRCLERYYGTLRPDLVILMLLESNDYRDNTRITTAGRFTPHYVLGSNGLVLRAAPSLRQRVSTFVRDHSIIFYYLTSLAEMLHVSDEVEPHSDQGALMLAILERMHDYTASRGTPLLIFYIGKASERSRERAAVERFCARRKIVIRNVPYLYAERVRGYGHWNDTGHESVATLIHDTLRDNNLLPAP